MKVLSIGDTHKPFVDWRIIAFIASLAKDYKPDLIVQQGDFIDGYNWSRFERDTDGPSASEEWEAALVAAKRFHKAFDESVPMVIVQGNHCRRILLRAMSVNIPKQLIVKLQDIFRYDNWTWWVEPRPFTVDHIDFIHGDELPGKAFQKAASTGRNIVQGHDHRGYLEYVKTFHRQVFGMSVGTCMDVESICARYANKSLLRSWLGCGTITDGVPQLHPFRPARRR